MSLNREVLLLPKDGDRLSLLGRSLMVVCPCPCQVWNYKLLYCYLLQPLSNIVDNKVDRSSSFFWSFWHQASIFSILWRDIITAAVILTGMPLDDYMKIAAQIQDATHYGDSLEWKTRQESIIGLLQKSKKIYFFSKSFFNLEDLLTSPKKIANLRPCLLEPEMTDRQLAALQADLTDLFTIVRKSLCCLHSLIIGVFLFLRHLCSSDLHKHACVAEAAKIWFTYSFSSKSVKWALISMEFFKPKTNWQGFPWSWLYLSGGIRDCALLRMHGIFAIQYISKRWKWSDISWRWSKKTVSAALYTPFPSSIKTQSSRFETPRKKILTRTRRDLAKKFLNVLDLFYFKIYFQRTEGLFFSA